MALKCFIQVDTLITGAMTLDSVDRKVDVVHQKMDTADQKMDTIGQNIRTVLEVRFYILMQGSGLTVYLDYI